MKHLNIKLLEKNIESIAGYDLSKNNVFGSSYAVFQNGKRVYKKHFGVSNPLNSYATNDATIYRLASMTKPVTAVAMLILADRGLISLDDEVKKYIPVFDGIHIITPTGEDLGPTKTDVTIKHLLTHTSGFGSGKPVELTNNDRITIADTVNAFARAGLDFEPFTKNAYSGVAAFDVLAAIAEKVTEIDYEEFLIKEIFEPCEMKDTRFNLSQNQWDRLMTMHNKTDGKSTIGEMTEGCVFSAFPQTHKLAGAGLASTLDDYSKFADMLLNKGKTGDKQIVSEKTFALMHTPFVPETIMPGNQSWGLGVRVITKSDYPGLPVGTFGWSGAYGSHFWIDPVNNITAVFMKNSLFDGGAGNKSAVRFEKAVYDSVE